MEKVTDKIINAGVNDREITLFEGQYHLEKGMAYNSYVILDEKPAIMDTVDPRGTAEWLSNVEQALAGREPVYLVIHHMEPDHAGSIRELLSRYPSLQIVTSAMALMMMKQFLEEDLAKGALIVKEGDTLALGEHTLHFVSAPMVHWPEVMVSYEESEKAVFSADGFGKFGTRDADEDWTCEARRYYFNICGKYGMQVQALLKKLSGLDVSVICPLHGPVLTENLDFYIGKYDIWSRYEAEDKGIFIAYASIHGNTEEAALRLKEMLEEAGAEKVAVSNLCVDDIHEAVEDAFRYDRLVLASSSYDAGLFPPMENFLRLLKAKNYQKRTAALIENGSWAPSAGRVMKELLSGMPQLTLLEPMVTIKSAVKPETIAELEALAKTLVKS